MFSPFGYGFGGFSMFSVMFCIVWILMLIVIVSSLVSSFRQWNKDNHSPRLTVPVTVVGKREDYRRRRNGNHTSHRTYYYVTFQVESGDRMELQLQGNEYGLLVEGDRGNLTFQGSRYLGFART
ncbi:MAG: DUF2500 domain-containing protein [Oscillospiraceae bacterium]|nr:DUF2500 domain-containing protein [Oscillospiraceae bacterium]